MIRLIPASFLILALSALAMPLVACESPVERAIRVEREAVEDVQEARKEVLEQQREAVKEIQREARAGDIAGVADEKLEGTREIAEAEHDLDEAKIEATEDITEAHQDAGLTTGSLTRE